jgi:hypothetical protein
MDNPEQLALRAQIKLRHMCLGVFGSDVYSRKSDSSCYFWKMCCELTIVEKQKVG